MRRRTWIPAVLVLALLATAARPAGDALQSLVKAERAFARQSLEQGVRDAFIANLAEDGVIFRPLAMNGRKAWEARGPVAATLAWEPVYAEVSAAGDLGWTTGPWKFTPDDTSRAPGFGHFVSVWRWRVDTGWKVAVDTGISHGRPVRGIGERPLEAGPKHTRPGPAGADLRALDLGWSEEARAKGGEAAFQAWTAPDVRCYLYGREPVTGREAARALLSGAPSATVWNPEVQLVAVSGDLGCTYGILERRTTADASPDSSVYLHIWRRGSNGKWQAALVLENPLPRAEKK